jgi:hypothetical protein
MGTHSLNVVGIDIKPRARNLADGVQIALEVGHQGLHKQPPARSLLEAAYCGRNVRCAAVGQIIPVHTR